MKPPKRLLTIKEAAEIYGPSIWYWRERVWAGDVPVLKSGRKQLLDRLDLDDFIEKNKTFEAPR